MNDTFINLHTVQTVVECSNVLFDFLLTVKAVPHECVIRTSQP